MEPTDAAISAAGSQWQERGWVVIPSLVPTEVIDAALDDLWTMFAPPEVFHVGGEDPRRSEFFERRDPELVFDTAEPHGPGFRADQLLGVRRFPFPGSGRLNRLLVHPDVLAFARCALGTEAVRLYLAQAWTKYSGVVDYEQPLHRDHNHSLLPARPERPWWHLEAFLYLSDVRQESAGPTRLVSVDATSDVGARAPLARAEARDLYDQEVSALGPRGSLLAYRPDVWHRATDLSEPEGARAVLAMAYKPADSEWVGYSPLSNLAPDFYFQQFVAGSTPDELSVFGIPPPGHPFWTESTIDEFEAMYPGLDAEPWRAGL